MFEHLLKKYPDIEIVIEDLGDLRPEVGILRDHFGFKGMKIYQFSLDPNEKNNDFPDRENLILYTGTHDNQTIKGWYLSKDQDTQQEVNELFREKGCDEEKLAHRFIHGVFQSIAELSVVTVQDILNLGDEARLNQPGTTGSPNWEWRMTSLEKLKEEIPIIHDLIEKTKRL